MHSETHEHAIDIEKMRASNTPRVLADRHGARFQGFDGKPALVARGAAGLAAPPHILTSPDGRQTIGSVRAKLRGQLLALGIEDIIPIARLRR